MRIIILNDRIPPENMGGAGRVAWSLACGLRDAGHDVHVIAATPGTAFENTRDGISTVHIHSKYPARFRAYFALYNPQTVGELGRLFGKIQPDVVNAHNIHADLSYYSLAVAHRSGIATAFTSHDVMPFAYSRLCHYVDPTRKGVDSPREYRLPRFYNLRQMRFRYNPVRNMIVRHILSKYASARISVSEALRQSLEANGLPPFRVVHNGIDPASLSVSAEAVEALRAKLGLSGRKVILVAGRMTRDKGKLQLLAALKRVVERVPEALLLILSPAGLGQRGLDNPEFTHLLDTHIRSGGWLQGDELAAAFNLADVVTVPSIIMDSFPTVNLEAMAAGKPVVSTCHGGSPEAVLDGETGYIVNPFDTAQFADRLERLLLDNDLRHRMGQAGRQRVEHMFSLGGQVGKMVGIYKEIGLSPQNP